MHVVLSYVEALAHERVDFSNAAAKFPRSFHFSHFKLMGLNIIRCNSRILSAVLRIKSENVINSLLIP